MIIHWFLWYKDSKNVAETESGLEFRAIPSVIVPSFRSGRLQATSMILFAPSLKGGFFFTLLKGVLKCLWRADPSGVSFLVHGGWQWAPAVADVPTPTCCTLPAPVLSYESRASLSVPRSHTHIAAHFLLRCTSRQPLPSAVDQNRVVRHMLLTAAAKIWPQKGFSL